LLLLSGIEYAKLTIILGTLITTSAMDIRTREIPPRIWSIIIPVLILFTSVELFLMKNLFYVIVTVVGVVIVVIAVGLLYYVGLMGGGDLFALTAIAVANPWNPLSFIRGGDIDFMPFVVPVLIYSSVSVSFLVVAYFFINISFHRKDLSSLPTKYKVLYMFTAVPVSVNDLLRKKYWYPLERPWKRERYSLFFDVGEEDADIKEILHKMVEEGSISPQERLWSTYGIPFIVLILLGYILSILGGDKLLLNILHTILG
jgi:preflagellin peptidase FlaK